MDPETRDDIADKYGYQHGKCPRCHRSIWSDTSVFDCVCGWTNEPEENQPDEAIEDEQ